MARAVGMCGLAHGDPSRLMGATEHNPTGHWEVEDLTDFDEQLLLDLGGKWSAPPRMDPGALEELAAGPKGEEAAKLHSEVFGDSRWVWKDPRLCIVLPFWRRVLADSFVVVAVVRNPLEVAQSLGRRNGFSVPYSFALWERHVRSSIEGAHGLENVLVHYERVIDDPAREVGRVAEFLVGRGLGETPDPEALRRFVRDEHRHVRTSFEQLSSHPDASEEMLSLYRLLSEADRLPEPSELPPETPNLQLAFDEHKRMTRWEDEALQLRDGVEQMRQLHDAALADIEKLRRWVDESRADAAKAWAEVRRLEAENSDLHELRTMLLDELESVIAERDRLRSELAAYERSAFMRLAAVAQRWASRIWGEDSIHRRKRR